MELLIRDDCSGYTVPQAEREALIAFYLAAGGGLDTSDANTHLDRYILGCRQSDLNK